jgi:biuret amidohydrolase
MGAGMRVVTVTAAPQALSIDLDRTALVLIDTQRNFIESGGFGASPGNDVSLLRAAIEPCRQRLAAARAAGLMVVHTRVGHRPDLSDAPRSKVERSAPSSRIGDRGPMGRILIRGEPGQDIVPELYPRDEEPVVDKPGKGAFYATDFGALLSCRGIENLIVCGVTTEVCVHATMREANDCRYRCLVPADCCASYFPAFHHTALAMIKAQGGIQGWEAGLTRVFVQSFALTIGGFIALRPALEMYMTPLLGVVCFSVIIVSWFGGVRWFRGIPAVLVAIASGCLIARGSALLGKPIGGMSVAALGASFANFGFSVPLPAFGHVFAGFAFLGVILFTAIPFGIYDLVEAMDNVESTAVGGDSFPTTRVLSANGVVSLVGCAKFAVTEPAAEHPEPHETAMTSGV